MLRTILFLLDVVVGVRVLVGLVRQLLDIGLSLLTLLRLVGLSAIWASFGVLSLEIGRNSQANLLRFFLFDQFCVGLLLNVFDIHHLHQHPLLLIDLNLPIVQFLALAFRWLVLFLLGELPGLIAKSGVEGIEFLVNGDVSGVVGFGEEGRRGDADNGDAKRSVFIVDCPLFFCLGRALLLRLAYHYFWLGIAFLAGLALTRLSLRLSINCP